MQEVISRPSDDIPYQILEDDWSVIGLILVLLLGVIFRWFIEPANTLLPCN